MNNFYFDILALLPTLLFDLTCNRFAILFAHLSSMVVKARWDLN